METKGVITIGKTGLRAGIAAGSGACDVWAPEYREAPVNGSEYELEFPEGGTELPVL